jgi:hypothetical protein
MFYIRSGLGRYLNPYHSGPLSRNGVKAQICL